MKAIEIDCEQGSTDWHQARLGIITASRVKDLITPTGKPTANAARKTYLAQLLGERLSGQLQSNFVTPAMQRGKDLEEQARARYMLITGRTVRQVGFVTTEELRGKCGCSPDGICADRGLEIKIPLIQNVIQILLDPAMIEEYGLQIQFSMWITGLPKWDLFVFSDSSGVPSKIYEIDASEKMHAAFNEHIPAFCAELAECEARLIGMGAGGVRGLAAQGSDWPEGLK